MVVVEFCRAPKRLQMGARVPQRAEPGSGRADRLPELQAQHDAARAEDSARQEPVQ